MRRVAIGLTVLSTLGLGSWFAAPRHWELLMTTEELRRCELRVPPWDEWHQRPPWYAWLLWNYWYDAPQELAVEGTRHTDRKVHQQRLCYWSKGPESDPDRVAALARANQRLQKELRSQLENSGQRGDDARIQQLVDELPAWLDEIRAVSRETHTRESMQRFLDVWSAAPYAYVMLMLPYTDWRLVRVRQANRITQRYDKDAVVRLRYRAGFIVPKHALPTNE